METSKTKTTTECRRWRATIAYDGSRYSGWQIQPGKITIQGELERILSELFATPIRVHSSGRTDAGVHARAQVAHFDTPLGLCEKCSAELAPPHRKWSPPPWKGGEPEPPHRKWFSPAKLQHALNGLLDSDIRVSVLQKTKMDFHARFSAVAKEYRYFIWNGNIVPPFLRHYRCHVGKSLNAVEMQKAADCLVGQHDFAAFSANPHREVDGTVRNLYELKVKRRGSEVMICARADGFLYKMVRSLAGFLIRVGQGDVDAFVAPDVLSSAVRTARVPTAPGCGLFLWKVEY